MKNYTAEELSQALGSIKSIIHKCEKAQEKFPEGSPHHTLLGNRLKAMYISKALIAEALYEVNPSTAPQSSADASRNLELLLASLNQLQTTDLGAERIRKNLSLDTDDVVRWCREKVKAPNASITRKGKNWYIAVDGYEITVNAHSYTIITAHRRT